ncbi:hypothetical protein K1719_009691 [Acacia pycnantha]|nr:hypothetical protein K1719_009691 [Acacia pycnantha]
MRRALNPLPLLKMESRGCSQSTRSPKFISSKSNVVDAWNEVQRNFDRLAKDGYLHRADFAQCIGMKDSKEFALELFDAPRP